MKFSSNKLYLPRLTLKSYFFGLSDLFSDLYLTFLVGEWSELSLSLSLLCLDLLAPFLVFLVEEDDCSSNCLKDLFDFLPVDVDGSSSMIFFFVEVDAHAN